MYAYVFMSFSDNSVGKESICNSGDPGSFPGLGRSTGARIGYIYIYVYIHPDVQIYTHALPQKTLKDDDNPPLYINT